MFNPHVRKVYMANADGLRSQCDATCTQLRVMADSAR